MLSDKISNTEGPINQGHSVQYGFDVAGVPTIQVRLYDDYVPAGESGVYGAQGYTSQHRDPGFLRRLAIDLLEGAEKLENLQAQAERTARNLASLEADVKS